MNLGFLRLEDFLLPAPLPSLTSTFLVLGLTVIGRGITSRLQRKRATALDQVGGFLIATSLLAFLATVLGMFHLTPPIFRGALRLLGLLVAALGVLRLKDIRWLWELLSTEVKRYSGVQKVPTLIGLGICLGFLGSSLAPPTDADSLDYHLGAPLDWLRHGGFTARQDWPTARLCGLGESLNLVGLASGTDNLGSILQFSGLIISIICLISLATTTSSRLLGFMLIASCPVMCALVSSQKPQLLPAASCVYSLLLLAQRRDNIDTYSLLTASVGIAFAVGCKYSFILSGGIAALLGGVLAHKRGCLRNAAFILAGSLLLLVVPLYCRNYLLYGDPVTPIGERFKTNPDPEIIFLGKLLREGGVKPGLKNLLTFPIALAITLSPGAISTVLGIGTFAFFLAFRGPRANRMLLYASFLSGVTTLLLSQWAPRFFLEPYLWCGAAAVMSANQSPPRSSLAALTLQGSIVLLFSWYGALSLFPGALSARWREEVMLRNANGANEAKWINEATPRNSKLLCSVRSRALIPRDFVVTPTLELFSNESAVLTRIETLIAQNGITCLICRLPPEEDSGYVYTERRGIALSAPQPFHYMTRNPLNRGAVTYLQPFILKTEIQTK